MVYVICSDRNMDSNILDICLGEMKKENQVVSLKLAREMKELGVEEDSIFWWVKHIKSGSNHYIWDLVYSKDENDLVNEYVSTYTVSELGEMLPCDYTTCRTLFSLMGRKRICWCCASPENAEDIYYEYADIEVNARAKMWIYLKKREIKRKKR